MSSFTSLSLTPTPLVTFNIALPSRTETAIAESRAFVIHLLSGDAAGAALADLFRSGNDESERIAAGLRQAGCEVVPTGGPGEMPMLRGAAILCVLKCRVLDKPCTGLVRVRDHVIVLGEVVEIIGEEDGGNFGLIYADRHYRQLGGTVSTGGTAE